MVKVHPKDALKEKNRDSNKIKNDRIKDEKKIRKYEDEKRRKKKKVKVEKNKIFEEKKKFSSSSESASTSTDEIDDIPTDKKEHQNQLIEDERKRLLEPGFPKLPKYEVKPVFDADGNQYYVKNISFLLPFYIIYLISPYWEWILMFQICLTYGCITFSYFFAPYILLVDEMIWYMDIIFGIDSVLRVIIEVWRKINTIPCIIYPLPYTLKQLLMDLISIVPFEEIYLRSVSKIDLNVILHIDFYRMNRLLRFSRAFSFLTVAVNERRISSMLMFTIKYLTQYVLFLHFVACIIFFILPADPIQILLHTRKEELKQSWVRTLHVEKQNYGNEPIDDYALTFSFVTCVVTTTGYGDFSATRTLEMVFICLSMLIGAIIISGFFSSGLTSFLLEQDGARFDLFFRLDVIVSYLKRIKAHQFFIGKVIEYYKLLWNYCEGVADVKLMSEIPQTFVEELYYDICEEMFHKTRLFRGLEQSFLREVAGITHFVLYNPKMLLCTSGGHALNMYYILQGEVIVYSKRQTHKPAAILRAGSVFGEVNLFFSYPYASNVETLTFCQLIVLKKFELYELFEKRKELLEILRKRVIDILSSAKDEYQIIGKEPIYWVEKQVSDTKKKSKFPVVFRKANGWNERVKGDVIDDTFQTLIVESNCRYRRYEKEHNRVFETCQIPPTLQVKGFYQGWNVFVSFLTIYSAMMAPYCTFFRSNIVIINYLCDMDTHFEILLCIVYMIDLLLEIYFCCPVTGKFFRVRDGFRLKIVAASFWLDIVGILPFIITQFDFIPHIRHAGILSRFLRLYKVIRYFNYFDNVYPHSLFMFRLIRATCSIIFATHITACYLYGFACVPLENSLTHQCRKTSWLRSFTQGKTGPEDKIRHDIIGKRNGYWAAFYFAAVTITTVGYGDFNPQTRTEMIFLASIQLLSFCVTGYFTALLTSALCCAVKPKVEFQQKLLGVKEFMNFKGVSQIIQRRVVEHYYLQDQLWSGVSLPDDAYFLMYDSPQYLHEDALYLEVELLFDGIPIFAALDPKILVDVTKLMRRYLVAPGTIFIRKGEVRRQMYIIARGSVAVINEENRSIPERIYDDSGHFGIRDLLFGEPSHHDIKTISNCVLFEVELKDLREAFRNDVELLRKLEKEKETLQPIVEEMIRELSIQYGDREESSAPPQIHSFIEFPKNESENMPYCTYDEFMHVFIAVQRSGLFQMLLMKRTIHPAGAFAKAWTCFMSLNATFTIVLIVMETLTGRSYPAIIMFPLDVINWIDIYLKFHWAYYTKENLFIRHPLKTAINYVWKKDFVFDVVITIPFELIIPIIMSNNPMGYAKTHGWFRVLRWTRFAQIIRIPAALYIFHHIFKMRNLLLLVFYMTITFALCTILSCVAESMACPIGQAIWKEGDQNRLTFCLAGTHMRMKESLRIDSAFERWIVGVYYISQGLFSIGYGDLNTLSISEMNLLTFVAFAGMIEDRTYRIQCLMLFLFEGFVIIRCVLADITAAEVDIDAARNEFHEAMLCLELVMARERIPKNIQSHVIDHMYYTWDMSKGVQPRQLFRDLNPALEADLFDDLMGDQLMKVPIFEGLRENIVRSICQVMSRSFFRKGERITRFGNMERELFVIVHGKVWITDRNLDWMETLSVSDSFGESSIVHGTRRSYNAIAATDLEVFVLSLSDFEGVLERYPSIMNELEERLGKKNFKMDLFQREGPMEQEILSDEEIVTLSKQIKRLLRNNSIIDADEDLIFEDIKIAWFKRKIIDSGVEDANIPFIYFAKKEKRQTAHLIHPNCGFMKFFHFIIFCISYLSPALAAYNISFAEEQTSLVAENIQFITDLIEIPMYVYIFLNFFTPFQNPDFSYCKSWTKIALRYLIRPGGFLLDLVSSIPIGNIQPGTYDVFRFLRCIRFLRLVHFYRTHLAKANDLGTSVLRYKVTLSLSMFVFMLHGIACVFYSIASCSCLHANKEISPKYTCSDEDVPNMCRLGTWTYVFVQDNDMVEIRRLEQWRWWVRSLYWVVTTVSTTGFGDITPQNTKETLLSIITIFCGAFIMSIILSHFASGLSSSTSTYREHIYQMNLLLKHLETMGLSKGRLADVSSYFLRRWECSRGISYHQITRVLPSSMNASISYLLYSDVTYKCELFSYRLNAMFVRQLCSMFEHHIYTPGINIANAGYLEKLGIIDGKTMHGGTLFLVFKGKVSAYGKDADGEMILVETYEVGEIFGHDTVLFFDYPFDKDYRAEIYTEVLSLSQNEVIELADQYSQFATNLQNILKSEFNRLKDRMSIFGNASPFHKKNNLDSVNAEKEDEEDTNDDMDAVRMKQPLLHVQKTVSLDRIHLDKLNPVPNQLEHPLSKKKAADSISVRARRSTRLKSFNIQREKGFGKAKLNLEKFKQNQNQQAKKNARPDR